MEQLASEEHRNQVASNIDGDERLTPDEKALALVLCEDQYQQLSSGSAVRPDHWDDQIPDRLAALTQPAELCPQDGRVLGNVWTVSSFETSVARQLSLEDNEAKRVVSLLCRPAGSLSKSETAEAASLRRRLTLRCGEVWLFDVETGAPDPFADLDIGQLPCRLGLPYKMGEEFAAFSLEAPVGAHRPCAFQIGWFFHRYWRPGGRTKSICGGNDLDGLSEWLAVAPTLDQLSGDLRVGVVEDAEAEDWEPYDAQ